MTCPSHLGGFRIPKTILGSLLGKSSMTNEGFSGTSSSITRGLMVDLTLPPAQPMIIKHESTVRVCHTWNRPTVVIVSHLLSS